MIVGLVSSLLLIAGAYSRAERNLEQTNKYIKENIVNVEKFGLLGLSRANCENERT